jgi:hypothetical protein
MLRICLYKLKKITINFVQGNWSPGGIRNQDLPIINVSTNHNIAL